MTKQKTLQDVLKEMSPQRRKQVLGKAEQISREYQALKTLRKARAKTQVEVAKALQVTQPYVAKLERRSDLMLSVLKKYVRSVGGELELAAKFPDTGRIILNGLGALDEGQERTGRRPKSKNSKGRVAALGIR